MTYENFTIKAQDAILKAQQMASELDQQMVDTCHLCSALIETDEKLVEFLFEKMGAKLSKVKFELDTEMRKMPHDGHDHDHDHEGSELSPLALRVKAMESLLVEKGYVDPKALDQQVAAYAAFAYLAAETTVDLGEAQKPATPPTPDPRRAPSAR